MRKIALLLVALLLFSGVAFADVTVSGSVSAGWGFGDGVYGVWRQRSEVRFTAKVDEVNTAVVGFRWAHNDAAAANVRDGYIVTDLGAVLGLDGVTLKSQVGRFEADSFNVSTVTGLEKEDQADGWGTRTQLIQLDLGVDPVKVRFVLQPGQGDDMAILLALSGAFGPLTAEFFYTDEGAGVAMGDGRLGVGAAFAQDLGFAALKAGVDFQYGLESEVWKYGVGVSLANIADVAKFGASVFGEKDNELIGLALDLNVAPVAYAGFDLGVIIDLQDDADALGFFEASAYAKAGAATYRLGYIMGENFGLKGDWKGLANPGNGNSAVFFNAALSF